MSEAPDAAVVTVGTELVTGLRQDTNATEVCAALTSAGFRVREVVTTGDDLDSLERTLARLAADCAMVVVTGGLGPTHDDVTREAAAAALGLGLIRDRELVALLEPVAARHSEPGAAHQVLRQADVLQGARVLRPTSGTAPGQVVGTPGGSMALLPGPPAEMRGMLAEILAPAWEGRRSVSLGVGGMPETDVGVVAQDALSGVEGVRLSLLASPGDVRVVLSDAGGGAQALERAADAVRRALGDACYGELSLAGSVLAIASERGLRIAVAESCTGGLVAAALTDVPGSSQAFVGGVVAYSDEAKIRLLGVPAELIATHGAVSGPVAEAMAAGALERLRADVAVALTGIAGPGGGSADKPVGLVWSAVADAGATSSSSRVVHGDRHRVRERAAAGALHLIRSRMLSG